MNSMRFFVCILILFFFSSVSAYSLIGISEAKQMTENGEALMVDVRAPEYYKEGHSAGATLFPLENMEDLIRQGKQPFSISDALILYCDCPAEESSFMAASILEHYGFSKIYVMKGGWQAWKDAGFPVATGGEPGSLPKRKEECKTCETQAPQTLSPALPQTREPEKNPIPILFFFFIVVCIGIVGMMLVYAHFKKR